MKAWLWATLILLGIVVLFGILFLINIFIVNRPI
jgi:hypothetical protein